MKYLLLLVLPLLRLYSFTVVASVSPVTPNRYKERRRESTRIRGRGTRKLEATHTNIFDNEGTDPLLQIQHKPFLGGAGIAGLTDKTRVKTKTKHATETQQAGKRSSKGSSDSSDPSNDAQQLTTNEAKGSVLDLPVKTSILKKKNGKGSKGSSSMDSKETTSSNAKGSGMATKVYNGDSQSTHKLSLSLKSQKGDKVPKGYPTSNPKSNPPKYPEGAGNQSYESSSGTGKGSPKAKTPSPTHYRTPAPTRKPKSGGKGGKGGMGMKSDKTTHAPVQMPVQPPSPVSCTANSAGNTGSSNGDATLYDFFYQLEVIPGLSVEEINDTLLKEIEIAMANELIPSLFPAQCGTQLKLRRLQDTGRYVGLSTRPPDFVLNGCKFFCAFVFNFCSEVDE